MMKNRVVTATLGGAEAPTRTAATAPASHEIPTLCDTGTNMLALTWWPDMSCSVPRIAGLLFLSAVALMPGIARSWSGVLVDSDCYQAEERNINANDTTFDVDHDRDWEIRQCLPNLKTKEFILVERSGQSIKLNAEGNAKAKAMMPKTAKKSRVYVTVTGELEKNDVNVQSIAFEP